jgi:hypothetical protein
MGIEYVFYILHDAMALLPESTLCKLIRPYIKLDELRPDDAAEESLLAEVQDFRRASLAHEYYESFDVNWKNSDKLSLGTVAWIAECRPRPCLVASPTIQSAFTSRRSGVP